MQTGHIGGAGVSRIYLGAALFFALAGNIPPVAFEPSSSLVAVMRSVGLTFAFGALYLCLARERMADVARVLPSLLMFGVFLLYCALSAIWSLEPRATVIRVLELLVTILFAAVWSHAAARLCDSTGHLCRLIVHSVLAVTFYGIVMNLAIYGEPIKLAVNREESERARFVLGGLHPLAVGDLLAVAALAAVMAQAGLAWKLAVLLLLLPLLQLTDSTGARLLLVATVLFYLHAGALRSRHALLRLAVIWLAGAVAVSVVLLWQPAFLDRLVEDRRLTSMTGRSELWYTIWQSGLASTWLGTGFDAARGAIQEIFGIPYQTHNQYLSVLVELGYVGVGLFTLVFVYWIVMVARSLSIELWSLGLYVAVINISNASMFTKTWMIFLTVMCLVLSFFPVGARSTMPAATAPPRPVRAPSWSRARVPPRRPAR